MEVAKKRYIEAGSKYDRFFQQPLGGADRVKKSVEVEETVGYIMRRAREVQSQTAQIAKTLKGQNLRETCRNTFDFLFRHIAYEKDDYGKEQVRDPARLWADRKGDCDCYTLFISTVLLNLGIPHNLRITEYANKGYFQHIYVTVPDKGHRKGYHTIDVVADRFDMEVPFTNKKDFKMDLYQLNGIDDQNLGFLKAIGTGVKNATKWAGTGVKNATKWVGDKVGDGLRFFNRYVNPGTVLIRNGVLLLMKANFLNAAGRLRWAYLSKEQAAQHGISSTDYDKIAKTNKKLGTIYWQAGGKRDNLRKAILEGKGNEGGEVPKYAQAGEGELEHPSEEFRARNGSIIKFGLERGGGGWHVLVNGRKNGELENMEEYGGNVYGRNRKSEFYRFDTGSNTWQKISEGSVPSAIRDALKIDLKLSVTPLNGLEGLGSVGDYPNVIEFRNLPTEADILAASIDGLGEAVSTAAATTAGSGIVTTIAALLPKLETAGKAVSTAMNVAKGFKSSTNITTSNGQVSSVTTKYGGSGTSMLRPAITIPPPAEKPSSYPGNPVSKILVQAVQKQPVDGATQGKRDWLVRYLIDYHKRVNKPLDLNAVVGANKWWKSTKHAGNQVHEGFKAFGFNAASVYVAIQDFNRGHVPHDKEPAIVRPPVFSPAPPQEKPVTYPPYKQDVLPVAPPKVPEDTGGDISHTVTISDQGGSGGGTPAIAQPQTASRSFDTSQTSQSGALQRNLDTGTTSQQVTVQPKNKNNTWMWIGAGALGLGAAYLLSGNNGQDKDKKRKKATDSGVSGTPRPKGATTNKIRFTSKHLR